MYYLFALLSNNTRNISNIIKNSTIFILLILFLAIFLVILVISLIFLVLFPINIKR